MTRYMAKRAGRSVVASGGAGAAKAARARAAVAKEDRRSLILMGKGESRWLVCWIKKTVD